MGTRLRLGILIATIFGALSIAGPFHVEKPAAVTAIDTARTSVRSNDRAARSTESVHYDDSSLVLEASYMITNGHLAEPAAATVRDADVWELVRATLPDDGVAAIRQMNVVTDGQNGTLAMVHRSTVDAHTWVLSIDPAETDDVLRSTLVHEYAHMLTLLPEDLISNASSRNSCDGVRIEIGCAKYGSALAAWHDEFWSGRSEPATADLHEFVSAYAATNVHEDLAESFMAWTLDEILRPTGGVRERFAFFSERPEFVVARDAVRAKLAH